MNVENVDFYECSFVEFEQTLEKLSVFWRN